MRSRRTALVVVLAALSLVAGAFTAGADAPVGDLDVTAGPVAMNDVVLVDAFDVTTMQRYLPDTYPIQVVVTGPVVATFTDLPEGDYKVRVRIAPVAAADCYDRGYEWYDDASSYLTATPTAVTMGTTTAINVTVDRPIGCFEGTFHEYDTGSPITMMIPDPGGGDPQGVACITPYEVGGPLVGYFAYNRADATYAAIGVPGGRYVAVAHECAASRSDYLDAWYSGTFPVADLTGPYGALVDGFPGWIPDLRQTRRAEKFTVTAGVTVGGIDGILPLIPDCAGAAPTQIGTSLRDWIDGTAGDDVIVALAGNDVVRGLDGDDLICLDEGKDRAFGGSGIDRIYGGDGLDRIRGGAFRDILFGEAGDDFVLGGAGDDRMFGADGDDTLAGGPGAPDRAVGGPHTLGDTCYAELEVGCELP